VSGWPDGPSHPLWPALAASRTLLSALERRISEAKREGEIGSDVDAREAAVFFSAALVGIKVAARAGASSEHLRGIARMALRGLR
jgi:TetR/AcrR family transcriptional repressor of nem operon